MIRSLALGSVLLASFAVAGCTTEGVYVSRTQQQGYMLPLTTASCEQSCEAQFPAPEGYHSCLARCPDVVFLSGAVCSPEHRTMCVADSHFDRTRTGLAALVGVGVVAYIVLVYVLIGSAAVGS